MSRTTAKSPGTGLPSGHALRVAALLTMAWVVVSAGPVRADDALALITADMNVQMVLERSTANPGETVGLTVSVTNSGPLGASQARATLDLPAGLEFVSAVPAVGTYDVPSSTWNLGSLGVGQTRSLELVLRVGAGTAGTTLGCKASVSALEIDLDGSDNDASAELYVPAIDLDVDKTVNSIAPDEGQIVTYTVTVSNRGPDAATGVIVTDALPAGTTFVSSVPSRGTYSSASGAWDVGRIDGTETVTLGLIATIDPGTAGSTILNTASITASNEFDVDAANDSATASLTVFSADLELRQSIDQPAPNEGDTVTFTIAIENLGPNDVGGVMVSSPLTSGLSFVSASVDQGSYDPGTGNWNVGAIDTGEFFELRLSATVDLGTAGSTLTQASTITASSLQDPVSENNEATTAFTVFSADLGVSLAADLTLPDPGSAVVLTAILHNHGPNAATGVFLETTLPAGLSFANATTLHGSYDAGTGTWMVGAIDADSTAMLRIEVSVDGGTAGATLSSSIRVNASDLIDPKPSNDVAEASVRVRAADLRLQWESAASTVNAGDTLAWTLTAQNLGPDPAGAEVDVLVDSLLVVTDAVTSAGVYDPPSGRWTVGTLASGATANLILTTEVGVAPAGTLLAVAARRVDTVPVDPDAAGDSAQAEVRVASADLALEKVASVASADAGGRVDFTLTLANRGPDVATQIVVVDQLPPGFVYLGNNTTAGTYDPGTGEWSLASLAVGASKVLHLRTEIDTGFSGELLWNHARVSDSDQADPLDTDRADSASVMVQTADLATSVTSPPGAQAVGDTVTAGFTLRNRGPARATGIVLALDTDPGVVVLGATGTGTWEAPTRTWRLAQLNSGAATDLTVELVATEEAVFDATGISLRVVSLDQVDSDPTNDVARLELDLVATTSPLVGSATQTGVVLVPGAEPVEILALSIQNTSDTADTLRFVQIEEATNSAATLQQRSNSWQPLELITFGTRGRSFAATMVNGSARFEGLDLLVPPESTLQLSIRGGAGLLARDGDAMDLRADPTTGFGFASGGTLAAPAGLHPPGVFTVDGMSARQITMAKTSNDGVRTGVARQRVAEFVLPANGYQADVLQKLNLVQHGTARASTDGITREIARLEAWADDGDGDFDDEVDLRIGAFSFTGDRWELTGLARPVPVGGLRVFVSADIELGAEVGRTIQLGIPGPPDFGVGMLSNNDGPVDEDVDRATAKSIIAADRITVSAGSDASLVVRPGDRQARTFDIVLSNSYAVARTLRRIEIENVTVGTGTRQQLDASFELLSLRLDADDDGIIDELALDPVLATGTFVDGRVVFANLSVPVAQNSTQGFFVEARVSLQAADGDRLRLEIRGAASLEFEEPTTVSGSWPVQGDALLVDGMVAAQIGVNDFAADTLGSLEGPALALDVEIPGNGYRDDILRGIAVENLGTADLDDVAELRLWRDGGDGSFTTSGGDDLDLGPLTPIGARWQTPLLAQALPGGDTARFFITASVTATPTDSVTLQLQIPTAGIEVESGNDGPDVGVAALRARLLSSAPLLASLEFDRAVSVLGEQVRLRMILRNVGSEQIVGIQPSVLEVQGAALLQESGPQPPSLTLGPTDVDTLTWDFRAATAGVVTVAANATGSGDPSALERRALTASSGSHRVFVAATSFDLYPLPAAPSTVSQGQQRIVPLSLTFDHPAAEDVSEVEITSLELRVEDEFRGALDVAELLAAARVVEGTNLYATLASFAAGDSLLRFDFDPAVRLNTNDPVTLSVQLDLAAHTTAAGFCIALTDSASITARDAIGGGSVTLSLREGAYPVRSGLATVRGEVSELRLTHAAMGEPRAAPGTGAVPLMELFGENPGASGVTADIELQSISVDLLDENGATVQTPSGLLSRLRLRSAGITVAELTLGSTSDSLLVLELSPQVMIPVGPAIAMRLEADLAPDVSPTSFRARVRAGGVTALDRTSRDPVPVSGNPDPLVGARVHVEWPASGIGVAMLQGLPPTTILGETDRVAMRYSLRHPDGAGTASARADSLRIALRDPARAPLPLATFLDRVVVRQDGVVVATATDFSATPASASLALTSLPLAPGSTSEFEIVIDVEATAPDGFFELWMPGANPGLHDVNSGAALPLFAEAGSAFPLASGLSQLRAPARDLAVAMLSTAPAVVSPGQTAVDFAQLVLRNPSASDATGIHVERVVLGLLDRHGTPGRVSDAAARVALYGDGIELAAAAGVALDSTVVAFDLEPPLSIPAAGTRTLALRADLAGALGVEGMVWQLDASGVEVVQPSSALLAIDVVADQGRTFPMRTEAANAAALSLAESFSNFPNPFAAGRDLTAFVFNLEDDARLTLRIHTVVGETVVTLIDDESRPAGLYQDDRWDGRNGRGEVVRNGVYLARIEVRYRDGRRVEELRKIAVRR